MKIGIIGAGVIGKTLAGKLVNKGHQVRIANSRGPETLQEFSRKNGVEAVTSADAVKDVELIVLTIPLGQTPALKDLFKDVPREVIIVETMNYYPLRDGRIEEIEQGMINSAWVEKVIGRPVIKAFNNIGAYSLFAEGKPVGAPGRIALAVSGDDEAAKKTVIELVNQTGFDGYDAGSIADSWRHQPGTPAYCTDLTLAEAREARGRAIKEEAPVARDFVLNRMFSLDADYIRVAMKGNYPEGFVDKGVDFNREYFGLPARSKS
jgi:8-hydroxy-5-deazaflavin:NADPH oxidoreductase